MALNFVNKWNVTNFVFHSLCVSVVYILKPGQKWLETKWWWRWWWKRKDIESDSVAHGIAMDTYRKFFDDSIRIICCCCLFSRTWVVDGAWKLGVFTFKDLKNSTLFTLALLCLKFRLTACHEGFGKKMCEKQKIDTTTPKQRKKRKKN